MVMIKAPSPPARRNYSSVRTPSPLTQAGLQPPLWKIKLRNPNLIPPCPSPRPQLCEGSGGAGPGGGRGRLARGRLPPSTAGGTAQTLPNKLIISLVTLVFFVAKGPGLTAGAGGGIVPGPPAAFPSCPAAGASRVGPEVLPPPVGNCGNGALLRHGRAAGRSGEGPPWGRGVRRDRGAAVGPRGDGRSGGARREGRRGRRELLLSVSF